MLAVSSVHVGGVAFLPAQDQAALVRLLADIETRAKRLKKALSAVDQTYPAELAAAEIEGLRSLVSVGGCLTRGPG